MPESAARQATADGREVVPASSTAGLPTPLTVEGWLRRAAERWPDRPALAGVDDDRPLTHAQLRALVVELAGRLRAGGVGVGDVVLLALPDGPLAITALLAVASVATVMSVGVQEQAEEYARILDEVPVSAIVMDERPQAPLTRLAEERGLTLFEASGPTDAPSAITLTVLRPRRARPDRPVEADGDALYTLTSGTTAVPKIVAITHASLWASMESSRTWFGLSEHDRSLCLMPIAHLHSLIRCSLPVLAAGGFVTWAPGFDASRVPGWLDRVAPTFISAAPAVHRKLLAACDAAGWQPREETVRVFAASSDKLDTTTVHRLEERFGARVVQLYGLSETAPLIAATPYDGSRVPVGSTGRVNPAWRLECLGDDGRPVAPGELGEIALSGGFINRLVGRSGTHVQRFDDDGRFLSGDLGRLDADGALFVEGRVDDVINRGGQKVNPAAVEAAIASHAQVRAVVAFAVPDPVLGSRVAAAVELKDGAAVTSDDLIEHAGRSLRSYMVPERVYISEAIPRTGMGKLSRKAIAAQFVERPADDARPSEPETSAAVPTDILEGVLATYRHVLRRDDIDPHASFYDQGGDSLHSLYLHLELEGRFGVSVQPAAFARNSSATSLAAHVARLQGRGSPVRLAEVQAGDAPEPLVFVHGIGGGNFMAVAFARRGLAPDRRTLALTSTGPVVLEGEPRALSDLAPEYARLLRESAPGPYALIGHSLGAHMAVGVASSLFSQGAAVDLLTVIDDDAELLRQSFGVAGKAPASRTLADYYHHAVDQSPAGPYPGRILLIRTEEDDADYRSDPTAGWSEIALGGVTVAVVPGNHHTIVREQAMPTLARALLAELEAHREPPSATAPPPDPQRLLRYEARLAHVRGDRDAEVARYREAIAHDREQPSWVYENLAWALFGADEQKEGFRALDEAIARDPWPLSIELRFASVLAPPGGRNRLVRAVRRLAAKWHRPDAHRFRARAVERARSLSADHPSVLLQRGRMEVMAGSPSAAEALYRQGLAMAPEHFRLHVELGELLRVLGRPAEAARLFAEANEQTPGLGGLTVMEARSYLEAGMPASALQTLERAPRLMDDTSTGHLVRGLALEELGHDEEALESFLKAAAVQPTAAEPAQHASETLARLGRHAEATAWSERAAANSGA